ncbi:aminopeptidase O [Eptesicus fuscus]|uniref:aminopeptidase O n=1 Tax=Eptesicus fuscus TaxID=29078 RepID=UPI0024044400|nr:aminopeptidase O [Eptesicus fuscus]
MQVHYLKGYFLLRFLARRLGDDTYFSFLRKFVHTFHGQLILSQDFLQMLLENIPEEKRLGLSVESIFRDWLECPGLPQPLQTERQAGAECGLARQVGAEVAKWNRVNRRPRKRKRRGTEEVFEKLLPDQLVLLLERLLEQKTLNPRTLRSLERTYCLSQQDAEVRHRWCELIVKHKYTTAYRTVEEFLQEDQVAWWWCLPVAACGVVVCAAQQCRGPPVLGRSRCLVTRTQHLGAAVSCAETPSPPEHSWHGHR